MVGSRLAHFEITSHLGSGGFGEVYRATDSKLGRSVAIKLLPDAFAQDTERVLRLEREARILASLNHPHVAAIYGIERADGHSFLVMELVEGETLAERICRGPIPVHETLEIAKQIAEALEAAHEKGIVHRDLKPANIKLNPDGAVKVLDFGLAKADEVSPSKTDLSNSPTMLSAGSISGVILGTATYMSPEQAKGRLVDKRTDIFAFACVLYEMLTARRAFDGDDVSEILARVIEREPDWTALPANVPPGIRQLLKRCLEKDLKKRRRDAGDVIADIEDSSNAAASIVTGRTTSASSLRLGWIAAATLALALALLALTHFREKAPEAPREARLDITTPATSTPMEFALSPDGQSIVFVASGDGPPRLWLRRLDQTTAQPLPGTEGARHPFWSPNGSSLGFFASRQLKRLDIAGGEPAVLADPADGSIGGSWNSDGVILFLRKRDLYRINASGAGQPVQVPLNFGSIIRFPQFVDQKHFTFYALGAADITGIYLASLDGGTPTRLGPSESEAVWLPPDRVAFVQQGRLWARRLDLKRAQLSGDADPIADAVGVDAFAHAALSVSADGKMAYRSQQAFATRLTWLDREGKSAGRPLDVESKLTGAEISRDGKRLAVDRTVHGNRDVFLIDLVRGGTQRFTTDLSVDGYPVWYPDGNRIAFETNRNGDFDIYVKSTNGTEPEGRW